MAKRKAIKIAVISRKGGSGKTTAVYHLAHGLALCGEKVLALEVDDNPRLHYDITGSDDAPDDSQTTYSLFTNPDMGIGRAAWRVSTREQVRSIPSLSTAAREQMIRSRGWHRPQDIDFVPGSERLRDLENKQHFAQSSAVRSTFEPLTQLAHALDVIDGDYDVILMDTLPALGMVQSNVLMAADAVIYVVDFDGGSRGDFKRTNDFFRTTVSQARQLGRTPPKVMGVIYNKYDPTIEENDVALLEAYTKPHYDPPNSDNFVGPVIPYPMLGMPIPFDKRRVVGAVNAHVSMHTWAPTTPIGEAMWLVTHGVYTMLAAGR